MGLNTLFHAYLKPPKNTHNHLFHLLSAVTPQPENKPFSNPFSPFPFYLGSSIDSLNMLGDKTLSKLRAVVYRVSVVVGLAGAELVAPLPEEVARHALVALGERRLLPAALDGAALACAVCWGWTK